MNKIDKLNSVNHLTKIFKELYVKDDVVDRKAPLKEFVTDPKLQK